ncbi:uncharacterized protein [Coffea arabica]|uniref:Uncharacterized protein isoform X2 n=1 Tax=Coffea arabica TaxID=13443 RepID=A0ABM4X467_COFAR
MSSVFERIKFLTKKFNAGAGPAGSSSLDRLGSSSLDRLDSALKGIKCYSEILSKVKEDWKFLRKLWESAHKGSDAATDEEKKNAHMSLKIEATAEEISLELIRFREEKQVKDEEFLNELAIDCRTKTGRLIAEVEEALDHLYLMWSRGGGSSSFRLQLHSLPPFDVYFRKDLLGYVQSTVSQLEVMTAIDWRYINLSKNTHYLSLSGSVRYLDSLGTTTDEVLQYVHDSGLPSLDACVGHVLSLALRIANRCRDYWSNYKAGRVEPRSRELFAFLVNLGSETHPSNPKFVGFLLNFLFALSCTGKVVIQHLVWGFCQYLFLGEYGHFQDEVAPVLGLLLYSTSILDDEDTAWSFIPEFQAVLVEMASLLESTGRDEKKLDNSPQYSELLTKICLLKAELFLVVQIHAMKSNTNTSSPSPGMLSCFEYIMDIRRQFPKTLQRYSKKWRPKTRLDREKSLALIESTFREEKSLYKSYRLKEITASVAKNSLLRLHFKIVIFKGGSFLTELLLLKSRNDERLMACGKDQIKVHFQKLEYITLILSDERVKDSEDILGTIGESFRRLTSFSYYFLDTQDEMINLSFSELLERVTHLIKAKLTDIIPQFPMFNFPKISNMEFLDFLRRRLGEVLRYERALTAPVKHHIEGIQLHLKSLRSFHKNVSELDIEKPPELEDLVDRVTDSAYKVEYVVDLIEVDAQSLDFFWLVAVEEELRLLRERARGLHLTTPDAEVQDSKNVTQVSVDKLSTKNTSAIDEIVVDLCNRENEILNQLTRGSSKLDIVFIAGMPGLGKTTFARKVYSSLEVMRHFHLRAWCSVSQEYEKRRLLLEILTGIHGLTEEIRQMRDEDLEDKLRKLLLKNKYLIVIDDIWGVGAWNDLKNSFPDDANGSRILFTSRLHRVASEIKPDSPPLPLGLFSQEESWQLLEKKVFKEECCPNELLGVGKEIAYHCQGLPLAVVAVAGILKMTEKCQNSWKTIADNLSSQIIDNPEAQCKEVLNLSYKHLPEYLKSCFLYLGVLNEDRDILVSKLIQFWIAEGFIPESNKGFEDVAEAFLMDLIDRSLVIISKRRSNGKVRACRLHDLVLDFCKSKTEDENFFQLITRNWKSGKIEVFSSWRLFEIHSTIDSQPQETENSYREGIKW